MFAEMECDVCDCIQFNGSRPSKFVPDGHGGGSFVPIDPRTEGEVPAPWVTPPVGQTGNCLAAANIATLYKELTDKQIAILEIDGGFATLLIGLVEFISLSVPVVGEIADLALAMISGAITAGVALMTTTFQSSLGDDMYAEVRCLFNCNAQSDGRITATAIQAIKDEFALWVPGSGYDSTSQALVTFWLNDWLDSLGPNGLTEWGHLGGITSSDCSACDCGWESLFDFTAVDYTSLFVGDSRGAWIPGLGISSEIASGSLYSLIQMALSPQVDITHFNCQFTAHSAGGSETIKVVTYYPESGVIEHPLPQGDHISRSFNELHSAQDYILSALVSTDLTATLLTEKWLVRGNGTKPAGWP